MLPYMQNDGIRTVVISYCRKGLTSLRATACNASRVLAIVEVSVRPSIVRPSVCYTFEPYQNGASQDHEIFTVGCPKD